MPKFMSVHRAPGLLQETWVENAQAIYKSTGAKFVQAYANLGTGFIFTIYEADSAEALVEQFEELGLPYEEMHEVQLSQSFDEMKGMLSQMGKI
ncbi:MAG: DUF4242 domain-containing protein [Polyangiaceae bacterium]